MMANIAVYAMQMGQPALLYLVPCTLGVFCVVSHREGTLGMMWRGPPSLTGVREPAPANAAEPVAATSSTAGDVENQGLLGADEAGTSTELREMSATEM